MIEAKFTRSQAAVIVAALSKHQEQTRGLDLVCSTTSLSRTSTARLSASSMLGLRIRR